MGGRGINLYRPNITLLTNQIYTSMATEQTSHIEISPAGKLFRVTSTRQPLGTTNRLAQQLAESVVLPFRDSSWPTGMYTGVGRDYLHIVAPLTKITIDTYWHPERSPEGEFYLTPSWTANNSRGAAKAKKEWVVPANVKFWLAVSQVRSSPPAEPMVTLVFKPQGGIIRVPFFPNVYNDCSRVCTGNGIRDINHKELFNTKPIPEIWDRYNALLQNASWNSDLLESARSAVSSKYIRFSPDSEAQLAPLPVDTSLLDALRIPSGRNINWLETINTYSGQNIF